MSINQTPASTRLASTKPLRLASLSGAQVARIRAAVDERTDITGPGGCWLWRGFINESGYGSFTVSELNRTIPAHRLVWILAHGEVPDGMVLDHLCRTTACVSPEHLEPVTPAENSRRSPLILKSACSKGHPFEDGSFYVSLGGVRDCKQCKKARVAEYAAKTNRATARADCPHCGKNLNTSGMSKHIKTQHPEHYSPRRPSEGMTDERHARRMELQRARRAAKRKEVA